MQKKDKLWLLLFIFGICSFALAVIIKVFVSDLFSLNEENFRFPYIGFLTKFFILVVLYFLIVGSVVRFPAKELLFKIIPFIPLTAVLYCLPDKFYAPISLMILFVTCMVLVPKFKTVVRFIINTIFISLLQLIIIWLRLDIKDIAAVFPNEYQFAVMNIDQIVILSLLYIFNRKRGDMYGLDFFRRKK